MPPHSQTPEERELSEERIKRWGAEYIGSAERSLKDAKQFASKEDWFTAYTYLFIAFNNLYCWHSKFHGDEREKIKAALKRLPGSCVNSFYDNHYVSLIRELNDRTPEEFGSSAEVIEDATGILKMREYFLGYGAAKCISHVEEVASPDAGGQEKLVTLTNVASSLLFTIRNNEFHAIKGPHRLLDLHILHTAYELLLPLVDGLMPEAHPKFGPNDPSISGMR